MTNITDKIDSQQPVAWMVTTEDGFCQFYSAEYYDVAQQIAKRFVTMPAKLTPLYDRPAEEK